MFLRPSHSLNARIRALLGTRSFASSRDEIGPRGHVVPVLDRIRRRTLHRGISFLATRTAKLFVVVQRVMLKVSLLRARCASSFTRDDRVFSLRKKTSNISPLGFYPESDLLLCVSFIRNTSFSGSFCLLAKRRTLTVREKRCFLLLFLVIRRSVCE